MVTKEDFLYTFDPESYGVQRYTRKSDHYRSYFREVNYVGKD